jgi:hypothetical protein
MTRAKFSDASAAATGKTARAAGRGAKWTTKKVGKGGRWAAATTLIPFDKWLERKRAGLEDAAGFRDDTSGPVYKDVVHEPNTTRKREPDNRTIDDFTSEELLFTPRGRLALKEHQLKEMTAAFQKLKDAGEVTPEIEAEHMASRRRVESEITQLRRMVGPTSQPGPATTPPPVFVNPKNPTKGETPVKTPSNFGGATNAGAPPTLAPHIDHISSFEPENDAELLELLRQEVAGQHALAESMQQMFENCVSGKGLDPAAMQGVSDYADSFAENAANAQRAHQQFLAVYEAIIEAANNGTVMPYNGRFFSGEAAA